MMATPVQTTVSLTKTFLPVLRPGCIVSDVGSVKAEIVRGMERLLPIHYSLCSWSSHRRRGTVGRPCGEGRPFCGSSLHFDADEKNRRNGVEENRLAVA